MRPFAELPAPVTEAAGAIAGIGAALAVGGGAVSVAVGAFLNLQSRMAEIAAIAPRLAAALKAVGAAALPIGATVAVAAVLAQGWEAVTHSAEEAAAAQRLVADSVGTAQLKAFDTFVQSRRRGAGGFKGLANEILGTDFGPKMDEGKVALEEFNKLDANRPGAAANLIDAMEAAGQDTTKFKEAQEDANEELGHSVVQQTAAALAQKKYADAIVEGGHSEAELVRLRGDVVRTSQKQADVQGEVNKAIDEGTESTTTAADADKALGDAIKGVSDNLEELRSKWVENVAQAEGFTQGIEDTTSLDNFIASAASLGEATTDFRDNIKNLPADINLTKLALGGYNEEQTKAVDSLLALSDETTSYVATLIEQGAVGRDGTGEGKRTSRLVYGCHASGRVHDRPNRALPGSARPHRPAGHDGDRAVEL